MSNASKYTQMHDFLSAPSLPKAPEFAVLFGRADPHVAHAAGDLIMANLVEGLVITGAIGKDSGDILNRGFASEAAFQYDALMRDGSKRQYLPQLMLTDVTLEHRAMDGDDNAQFSLQKLRRWGADTSTLTAVAHSTSLARLAETLRFYASMTPLKPTVVHRKPSAHPFNAEAAKDQQEAALELLRLADYPDLGLLLPDAKPPTDLDDLIKFAREKHGKTPMPPSALAKNALRLIPARLRVKVLQSAGRTK